MKVVAYFIIWCFVFSSILHKTLWLSCINGIIYYNKHGFYGIIYVGDLLIFFLSFEFFKVLPNRNKFWMLFNKATQSPDVSENQIFYKNFKDKKC